MITFFKKKSSFAKNEKSRGKAEKEKIRAHIFISGRVQGVFFRENTKKKAEKLGLFGWVKNIRDGRVEAIFEGEKKNVEKIVNWTRGGPIWAQVDDFDLVWEDCQGEFNNFEIRYDL